MSTNKNQSGKGMEPVKGYNLKAYRDNYDDIFALKKTPEEWCKLLDVKIMDADGWRMDCKSWDDKISEKEFQQRVCYCTIQISMKKYEELGE